MKIYALRHGFSKLNEFIKNEPLQAKTYDRYNKTFLDCPLAEEGIQEALKIRDEINKLPLKIVLVSPLYRALQTCKYILESHPNKLNINIIVDPNHSEFLGNSSDFPGNSKEILQNIFDKTNLKVDFSLFENLVQNYFYDFISEPHKSLIQKIIDKDSNKTNSLLDHVFSYGRPLLPERIESKQDFISRINKFGIKIKKQIHDNNINGKNILLITHSQVLRTLMANQLKIKPWGTKEDFDVKNAFLYEIDLNTLMN